MGEILGMEYSDVQINDFDEKEYFIDDWDDWYTKEEISEEIKEQNYWINDFPRETDHDHDGSNWSNDQIIKQMGIIHKCRWCGYWALNANSLRMRKCPKRPWWAFWGDCCEE